MPPSTVVAKRCLLAPEVVQASTMDCGPAALKCLLEGFGISVSYPRLQEACQTDVDGSSINVIEQVAVRLGLEAQDSAIHLIRSWTRVPARPASREPSTRDVLP